MSAVTADGQCSEFPDALARALAQGQQQVLLIDGASEEAQAQRLSEALTNGLEQIRLARKDKDLSRMDVGRRPSMGRRLYGTPRLDALLDRATQVYDWVVVHAAPPTTPSVGRWWAGAPIGCLWSSSATPPATTWSVASSGPAPPAPTRWVWWRSTRRRCRRRGETTPDEEQ
ncbi:MAG: hypothetical protein U0R78_00605 [Nocardioidaceae bacterium]